MAQQFKTKGQFREEHISRDKLILAQIGMFKEVNPKGGGLVTYLQEYAQADEDANIARTYLIKGEKSGELAGYYSLKTGSVIANEKPHYFRQNEFDTIPGIEIANFAVNKAYIDKHDGIDGLGQIIMMRFIFPRILEISSEIGVAIVYIFALPEDDLINYYQKHYGFARLPKSLERRIHSRIRPRYDESCVFMYLTVKDIERFMKKKTESIV